ncbi:MAG: 1-(5-phosphoribosyl)-5-[(5-phosphoribosylamino)methylideneamino]imidazole-4-carboxamide isomerase [bacterium]|nr:1-(5-phosphoribosyl)-5-[(5-phosphoribosylamino)methylideneamino]imidazole-4-carboxamide isomerase [bacterium]
MLIIPAIDIIDGQCVRLLKGDYDRQTTYSKTPVEMAKYFESCGADKIHFVDLNGARACRLINVETIADVCRSVSIPVEVGGGIRTVENIQNLFNLGVSQVVIGSLAVENPELLKGFLRQFGSEKIIVGIDVLNGIPRVSGWREGSSVTVDELLQGLAQAGVRTITSTDISRDGTLSSPNFEQYEYLVQTYPQLNIVASGGVSCPEDVRKLEEIGVAGVIIGKAIYEGKINLQQLC